MTEPLVSVRGLTVDYEVDGQRHRAVDGVDFDVAPHGALGLVGESGSGKSTIAFALARFLPAGAVIAADRLTVDGVDVLSLGPRALRDYRRYREVHPVWLFVAPALVLEQVVEFMLFDRPPLRNFGQWVYALLA